MPRFSRQLIGQRVLQAQTGVSSNERGQALEDLACHLIECIPGIADSIRNPVDYAEGGEIDILFANRQRDNGLWFLPTVFLVECKNWQQPVGSQALRVLVDRLRERACTLGILVSANGITGDPDDLTAAHHQISRALEQGLHIVVISIDELAGITVPGLVKLLLAKWMKLKAFKTSL
jgi:hypothetical protein